MIQRLKKKPVTIEGVRWTGNDVREIYDFADEAIVSYNMMERKFLIRTLEGVLTLKVGDWLLRGVKGEFYPCDHEILLLTYDVI